MAGLMTPYIVRQGDYLAKLAFVKGFDADEVWNDPKNEDLRKLRPDPNMLKPGDILYVPEKVAAEPPIEKGAENNYTAEVPKIEISMRLQDADGKPVANKKYWLTGVGDVIEGATDADGKFSAVIPVLTRELDLIVEDDLVTYHLLVGDLDPHGERSGAMQRLAALGFAGIASADGEESEEGYDARIVRAFQRAHGLEESGQLDDATYDAIRDAFGC